MFDIKLRPDISSSAALLCQINAERLNAAPMVHIIAINKIVYYQSSDRELLLGFPILDENSLRLQVYSDPSFAANYDHASQLGRIVSLAYKQNNVSLSFGSFTNQDE